MNTAATTRDSTVAPGVEKLLIKESLMLTYLGSALEIYSKMGERDSKTLKDSVSSFT